MGRSRTIGIAYALPNKLEFAHPGFFTGSNESMGDIADWDLQARSVAAAKSAIGPKYTVITARVDPAAYTMLDRDHGVAANSVPAGDDIRGAFGAGLPHADLWLVIRRACTTNFVVCGPGVIWKNGLLGQPPSAIAAVWASLVVYDGTSFDQLAIRPLAAPGKACLEDEGDPGREAPVAQLVQATSPEAQTCIPAIVLEPDWQVDAWDRTTPAQRAALRQALTAQFENAVAPTLRAMNLLN